MASEPVFVWSTIIGVFAIGLATGRLLYKPGVVTRWPYAILSAVTVLMMAVSLTNPSRAFVYALLAAVTVAMAAVVLTFLWPRDSHR